MFQRRRSYRLNIVDIIAHPWLRGPFEGEEDPVASPELVYEHM